MLSRKGEVAKRLYGPDSRMRHQAEAHLDSFSSCTVHLAMPASPYPQVVLCGFSRRCGKFLGGIKQRDLLPICLRCIYTPTSVCKPRIGMPTFGKPTFVQACRRGAARVSPHLVHRGRKGERLGIQKFRTASILDPAICRLIFQYASLTLSSQHHIT